MQGLIESIRQDEAARKEKALATYREILSRNDHPEPNDAATLREVMAALRYDTGRLQKDLALLRRAAELAPVAAKYDGAHQRWDDSTGRLYLFDRESERLAEERQLQRGPLVAETHHTKYAMDQAREAVAALGTLKAANPSLFGVVTEPVTTTTSKPPAGIGPRRLDGTVEPDANNVTMGRGIVIEEVVLAE